MTDPIRTEPEGFEPFQQPPPPPGRSAPRSETALSAGWERATLEKLAFASLNEQKAARRWKIGMRLAWLLFFIVVVGLGFSRATPTSAKSTPHTAVVEIKGEIAYGADASAE